ncbi:MAG: hypothetical protein ACPGU4_08400 [Flavobacteriales bacterium]
MKKSASLILLVLCLTLNSFSQEFVINLNDLVSETQIMSEDPDRMCFVWWIPDEYWAASLAGDPESAGEVGTILEVLGQYTVFSIADGEIGPYGNVDYVPLNAMLENVRVTDKHGDVFKPLTDKEVGGDAKNFLAMMKPMFASMLGPMGENMQFILFPKENLEGKRLLDPFSEGEFGVSLFEETIKFSNPLGSLYAPKSCPIDGKKWNGTWTYCPKHGEKLGE